MRAPFKAVVFDFDGTLAHTDIDFPAMKDRAHTTVCSLLPDAPHPGQTPLLEWLATLAPRLGSATAAHLSERIMAEVVELELAAARAGTLFPFTRPLLAALTDAGLPTAIVTRNCRRAVTTLFPEIETVTGSFLARDDVPAVKPDPLHVLTALTAIGARPEDALMVGDHLLDIATGQAAGLATGGVATGRISREELAEAGADYTAANAAELARELARRGLLPKLPEWESEGP